MPLSASAEHVPTADTMPDSANLDSQRDIILAVANPVTSPSRHAASNLIGYSGAVRYGVGQYAAATIDALKQHYGLHELAAWPINTLRLYCAVLEPSPGISRTHLLETLAADKRVVLAQPLQDFSVYATDKHTSTTAKAATAGVHYNDPYVDLQHGFVGTDAAIAQMDTQGQGMNIAIVDTNVDTSHPELQGRIREIHNMVGATPTAIAPGAHGTEIAGIIAANGNNYQGFVGMAPKAMLSVYTSCWYPPMPQATAHCNSFTLAKALAAIHDSSARIINLSLGGPADPLLYKMLSQLLSENRIVLAAMPPNGHMDGFPSNTPGVIVVRSSNSTPAPPGVISAPGNDILTTQPKGGYDFVSGSSMAAAHVSGIVALLMSLSPHLSTHALQDLLLRTSRVSDGMLQVNAAAAINAIAPSKNARSSPTVK
ncbi:S8 family serine peptidase [Xylella taiwanensis]|nr:S8 family serine peptidase [Xylella taiwanensis]MCD8457074.1 S8 family serine peptidase [Xylella taiwanensis]MCD8459484.1 S8 family serine peptidase [Xylella taiwanensis]MCD8461647.1 S8 family serine peptidase [Xylella taiwanensis]MCD8462325.1 S8 family serine peptidase [Xylella taiwanensis]MCD8466108.1 S8 family serine peptidase [Xylella taiwanensis]